MCAMRPLSPPPSLSPPASVRAGRRSVRSDAKQEELIGSREWKPWLLDSLEELRKPLEAGKIPRVYEKKSII